LKWYYFKKSTLVGEDMIMRCGLIVALLSLFISGSVLAGPAEDANAVVSRWAATFTANDADAILKLYTPDAILLGTVSPIIADTAEARRSYFSRLPGSGNKSAISEHRTMVLNDSAVLVTGFYNFTVMRNGKSVDNAARFSMLVVKRGNEWLIAHHHSSQKPQPRQ
jgi:uncharacterized protein (TIGR02246 family)